MTCYKATLVNTKGTSDKASTPRGIPGTKVQPSNGSPVELAQEWLQENQNYSENADTSINENKFDKTKAIIYMQQDMDWIRTQLVEQERDILDANMSMDNLKLDVQKLPCPT